MHKERAVVIRAKVRIETQSRGCGRCRFSDRDGGPLCVLFMDSRRRASVDAYLRLPECLGNEGPDNDIEHAWSDILGVPQDLGVIINNLREAQKEVEDYIGRHDPSLGKGRVE
jgi:hypothetical protein